MNQEWESRVRLRCPDDDETVKHVGIDIRLPISIQAFADLSKAYALCPCGKELGIGRNTLREDNSP